MINFNDWAKVTFQDRYDNTTNITCVGCVLILVVIGYFPSEDS